MYVPSREEIGVACKTKRPTSCVFLQKPKKGSDMLVKFEETVQIIKKRNKYI
jgi:hypothetical protein